MKRTEFELSIDKHLADKKTKRGLELFEKYIARIEWLHPEEEKYKSVGNKKYRVVNQMGEIVFESNNISNIAKEFCLSISRVTNSINSLTLLKGKYLVERCGNE